MNLDWYLTLRGISYKKCLVRNRLPREVLQQLGVKYRRIPILAIGRDVYCDTRCIIDKLEELYPENGLAGTTAFHKGVEYLLENWVIDAGPFWRTAGLIPPTADVMSDAEWTKDRSEMTGRPFEKDRIAEGRPEALAHSRMYFNFIESTLLADGRQFLLNTPRPTLADVHAGWVFDWTLQMAQNMFAALEKDVISDKVFPKTFAWVQRIRDAVAEDEKQKGKAQALSDADTINSILSSDFFESEGAVDEADPLKLKKGQMVDVAAIESGFNHHDIGELVSIGVKEVVIKSKVPDGKGHLRIHFPRTNFRVKAVQDAKL